MGSGKTLTAVALAYMEFSQNGKKVLSNIHLNFPYTHIDNQFLLENIVGTELDNCVTILDEAQQFLDARRSGGKLNLIWGYYTVQTRKRGVELFACFHHIDVMDKRFRRQIDVRGTCRKREEKPCSACRCPECGGSGMLNQKPCLACKGRGGTGRPGAKRGAKSEQCLYCGGTGKSEDKTEDCRQCWGTGFVCPRCLGYGNTGWYMTRFLDLRSGRRQRVTIFGPAFYGWYSTEELIPMTGKQLRISVEDL